MDKKSPVHHIPGVVVTRDTDLFFTFNNYYEIFSENMLTQVQVNMLHHIHNNRLHQTKL